MFAALLKTNQLTKRYSRDNCTECCRKADDGDLHRGLVLNVGVKYEVKLHDILPTMKGTSRQRDNINAQDRWFPIEL